MKNRIQSIRIRTVAAVSVVAIAAVMAFAVPALTGASAASAHAWDIPRQEFRMGPFKYCLWYCFVPGYCCEVEVPL